MSSRVLAKIFLVFLAGNLSADYPLIKYTNKSQDPIYSQQQQDVKSWYSGERDALSLILFQYVPHLSEDLFSIAAAFNLPYETLATLNGWDSPILFDSADRVIVPNLPGLFLQESPTSRREESMAETRKNQEGIHLVVSHGEEHTRSLIFHPGDKFTAKERVQFLSTIFSSPINGGVLTSKFGYRSSPFTGQTRYHPGIDIRAEIGTPVYAARDGQVLEVGVLNLYGNYIIIKHRGDYQTMYGHLKEAMVNEGQVVKAGELVALSGNSGKSTGPHLHFEIRRNKRPIDPLRITALKNK